MVSCKMKLNWKSITLPDYAEACLCYLLIHSSIIKLDYQSGFSTLNDEVYPLTDYPKIFMNG